MDSTAPPRTPPTWSFDPPTKEPIRAHCTHCGQSVIVMKARIVDVDSDRYRVEGRCQRCGEAVLFSV
jgi:DNA-directed RNA polymerase subunit RPC12/RpoP